MNKEHVDDKYQDQPNLDHQEQITKFENDLNVIQEEPPLVNDLSAGLRSHHTDHRTHTVIDFLQRPAIIGEYSWGTDKKRSEMVIPDMRIPDIFVKHPMFQEKLHGFTSIRATAVLTIQFQAMPFHAGRLLIASLPLPDLVEDRVAWTLGNVSRAMLLNHVQCDVSKDTEVTLRIPFVSPFNSYDLVTKKISWALVRGMVYSPLSVVGNIPVDIIVYGHFEDIQLGAPTTGYIEQVFAQMAPASYSDSRVRSKENQNKGGSTGGLSGVIQGLLGNVGSTLTKGANTINNGILTPASSIVGTLGGLLGFSKPLFVPQPSTVLRPATTFATTSGKDYSQPLSLSPETNVPYLRELDGTNVDEMSFDYLKKIPQFITNFVFAKSHVKNQLLFSYPILPGVPIPGKLAFKKDNLTTPPQTQPCHLAYISGPCQFWSGSLVYTFKFVKTDYHSGRVEFSFHPFSDYAADIPSDYVYRIVVDLRQKSEVSFTVPFVSRTPYKKMIFAEVTNQGHGLLQDYSVGRICCKVLSTLKTNSVVSDSIDVLVEINAGDDFHVIGPNAQLFHPVSIKANSPKIFAQMNSASGSKQEHIRSDAVISDPPSITSLNPYSSNLSFEVSGEAFTNFRTYIKRAAWYQDLPSSDPEQTYLEFQSHELIQPPYLSLAFYPFSSSEEYLGYAFKDGLVTPVSYVSAMYALYRGSVRLKILTENKDTLVSVTMTTDLKDSTTTTIPSYNTIRPQAIEQTSVKRIAEFQLPYYAGVLNSSFRLGENLTMTRNLVKVHTSDPVKHRFLAVSGGDDMDFSIFIGTPPVILGHTFFEKFVSQPEDKTTYQVYVDDSDPFFRIHEFPIAPRLTPVAEVGELVDLV